jgi:hypothetical protein
MSFSLTSRLVLRERKSEVTARRPSRFSKVRVFWGVSMSAVTSVRRVADWMAGQKSGSIRSRRSYCAPKVVNMR